MEDSEKFEGAKKPYSLHPIHISLAHELFIEKLTLTMPRYKSESGYVNMSTSEFIEVMNSANKDWTDSCRIINITMEEPSSQGLRFVRYDLWVSCINDLTMFTSRLDKAIESKIKELEK